MSHVDLKLALIRLLWDDVADDASCTCAPHDQCPQCQAMQALGLERWEGPEYAETRLSHLEQQLTRLRQIKRGNGATQT